MRERRELAGEILVNAKPPVDHDVVYVHVAAEGEIEGRLSRREFVHSYRPMEIGGEDPHGDRLDDIGVGRRRHRDGARRRLLPQSGFLKQEDIPLDAFLQTRTGAFYAQ